MSAAGLVLAALLVADVPADEPCQQVDVGICVPFDPEQPNEGRPNGAGGWVPDDPATVVPAPVVAPPAELAETGVRTAPTLALAGALVALGTALVLAGASSERRCRCGHAGNLHGSIGCLVGWHYPLRGGEPCLCNHYTPRRWSR